MADRLVRQNQPKMDIKITGNLSRNGQKTWYTFEWGKGANQRIATGIFTYVHCKTPEERNYNKEALTFKFLDYYQEYVNNNKTEGNRRPTASLSQFKIFLKKDKVSAVNITENLCLRFRKHLLTHFTGCIFR